MDDKIRPQDQSAEQWLECYRAEEVRIGSGHDIVKWTQEILSRPTKKERLEILMACPEDIRPAVRADVERAWRR